MYVLILKELLLILTIHSGILSTKDLSFLSCLDLSEVFILTLRKKGIRRSNSKSREKRCYKQNRCFF